MNYEIIVIFYVNTSLVEYISRENFLPPIRSIVTSNQIDKGSVHVCVRFFWFFL